MINLLPLVHPWSKAYHVCHQNFNLTGLNDCSPLVTALGRLSSQANNYMGYTRIFARAVSNPGPRPPWLQFWWRKWYAFYHSATCTDSRVVYVRIFARAISNPGPPDYSFDHKWYAFYQSAICTDSRLVKGISFTSSQSRSGNRATTLNEKSWRIRIRRIILHPS